MSETLTATFMSETLAATDFNYNCNIINSSGVDVVALEAYTPDATTTNAKQMYDQTLKLIKNGTQDVITAGTTGTIVLNDTHVDGNGQTQPNTVYNFIMARPGTFFPVKAAGATSFSTPRVFKDITISADDAKNMSLAENFWQTVLAYPTSQLAQDYNTAMTNVSNTATTTTQIDAGVEDFFKNKTHEFTTLTLGNVMAVQTYYRQYPFVWADYKESKTYYLYTSDGTKTTYVGSVALNLPASAGVDKKLPDGAIMFTDASGAQKKLYYTDGQFVDDTTKDVPAVCLQGLFTLKSSLTKVASDNTIIAILSGTVNNATVLGYYEKLQQDEHGDWSGMYDLLHPKNAMDVLNLLGQVMLVVMMLEMLGIGPSRLKELLTRKKAEKNGEEPSPTEVEQIRSDCKTEMQKLTETNQKLLDKFDAQLKMSDDLNATMKDLQQKMENRFNEAQRSSLQESLNKQGDMLNDMAQYEVTPNMETMGDTIASDIGTLQNAQTSELSDVLPGIKTDVTNLNTSLATEVQTISGAVSTEAQQEFNRTQEELKTAEGEAESIDKSTEETKEGRTAEEPEYEAKLEF